LVFVTACFYFSQVWRGIHVAYVTAMRPKNYRIKIMNFIRKTVFGGALAILSVSGNAFAGAIVNGDFEMDPPLSGWSVVTENGTVEQVGGKAELSTGQGTAAFSAVLVQGDDGYFSFPSPILLEADDLFFKFDAVFTDLGEDDTETGSGGTDQLNVWLYDELDSSFDVEIAAISINTSVTSFAFDLSAWIGRTVAFSFELVDEGDGRNSKVTIDNVRIEKRTLSTVPEPASLALIGSGLAGLGFSRRRWGRRSR
jgi:hypothetical protein